MMVRGSVARHARDMTDDPGACSICGRTGVVLLRHEHLDDGAEWSPVATWYVCKRHTNMININVLQLRPNERLTVRRLY